MLLRPFTGVILFFLLSLSPAQAALKLQADQHSLYQGEKLTLTLELDRKSDVTPDLRPLKKLFRVLGTRKVAVSSYSTGSMKALTRWIVTVRPLKAGDIEIPSLKVDGENSAAISLVVMPASENPAPSSDSLRPQFLKAELDQSEVYVNGQVILRLKLFHLQPLQQDASFTEPSVSNALIRPLNDEVQYKTEVRGISYHVLENSYTLFPREAGQLNVEPVFVTLRDSKGNVNELNSDAMVIDVLPTAFKNKKSLWLPAKMLHIEDNLHSTFNAISGEPLRRVITLEAHGLPASSLPSLSPLKNELADIKLMNVVLEERMTETGIISQRIEELLITPLERGELTLKAIDIPWWNTLNNQGEHISIAPRIIRVDQAAASVTQQNPQTTTTEQAVAEVTSNESGNSSLLIGLLTVIALISTLGCIYAINRLKRIEHEKEQAEAEQLHEELQLKQQIVMQIAENNCYEEFAEACVRNNPEIAKARMIEWAQAFWRDGDIYTLEQICEYANNQTLNFLVVDLEQHIYQPADDIWQGDLLLDAISKIRDRQTKTELDLQPDQSYFSYSAS